MEFHDHIWNRYDKCIQISTNMSGIGSLIREIYVNNSEICSKTNARLLRVKVLRVTFNIMMAKILGMSFINRVATLRHFGPRMNFAVHCL